MMDNDSSYAQVMAVASHQSTSENKHKASNHGATH